MDEYQIATKSVLPYLKEVLKWPPELIKGYGRVPVQVGTSTRWADFVCYIVRANKPYPYLLVEVKQEGLDLEQMVPQAESYSLILGVPFFCVTDGDKYHFYLTGNSQGNSIKLQNEVPRPSEETLQVGIDFIQLPPQLDPLVDLFFQALKTDSKFLKDTRAHSTDLKYWNKKIFANLSSIAYADLENAICHKMMVKVPNRKTILKTAKKEPGRFRKFLKFIADFKDDSEYELNRLLDPKRDLHIRGAGLFFVTQILAAAHPNEYVVLEANIARALKDLHLTDVVVNTDIINGYVYTNEICKKIYRDKLQTRLQKGHFGLAAGFELVTVHNFLWHYYAFYKQEKSWNG